MERIERGRRGRSPHSDGLQPVDAVRRISALHGRRKSVQQMDDTHVHWHAEIWGKDKEWDAEITEQGPIERNAWKSVSGDAPNAGIVRFQPWSGRTRVRLVMAYEPRAPVENVGDALGLLRRECQRASRVSRSTSRAVAGRRRLARRGSRRRRAMTAMQAIKKYAKRVDADLARTALDSASIPSVVSGLGVGTAEDELTLLVPDDKVRAALEILDGRNGASP